MRTRPLAVLLAWTVLTSACGARDRNHDGDPFNNDHTREGTVRLHDRPSMESTLTRYRLFQEDLFRVLDEHFGHRVWTPVNNQSGIVGSACDHDLPDSWGIVNLPLMSFRGTYPPERWRDVRAVVSAVGEKHGFLGADALADRPGHLDLVGTDSRYGGRYEFGLGKNTVLLLETGCHRWDKLPSPSPAP
jgi:hypothetical protein